MSLSIEIPADCGRPAGSAACTKCPATQNEQCPFADLDQWSVIKSSKPAVTAGASQGETNCSGEICESCQ